MKSLKNTLILAACMAALGIPAFAQTGGSRDGGERTGDRREGSWDDRRDGNWGDRRDDDDEPYWTRGDTRYGVPRADDMRTIRGLAHTLDESMDSMTTEFDHDRGSSGPSSYRGSGPVIALRSAVREFHAQVEANMSRPERTVAAYQRLKDSHDRFDSRDSHRDLGGRADRHRDRIRVTVMSIDRLYMRAWHQPDTDWRRIQWQANEIDELANRILLLAKRELYQPYYSREGRRNRGVLDRLEALRSAASEFNSQVSSRRRQDSDQLRWSFDRLQSARREASNQIGVLRSSTRNEFGRLNSMIQNLERETFRNSSTRR